MKTGMVSHEVIRERRQFGVFHLFCGSGGGAYGFAKARRAYKGVEGFFATLGGIDSDPDCCTDFEKLTGVHAACIDLFDVEMFRDFWGKEPPEDWREATPQDIKQAAGGKCPDVVFLSPPCKGFSGLLPEKSSKLPKYQALNKLVLRSIWLTVKAFENNLPAAILVENVPRITKRGAGLLREVKALLRACGYEFTEGTHDCGEIGGMGQIRKHFLLIARHPQKLQSFIYEPPKLPLRSIGSVLENLPPPGDTEAAGAMHRLPRLQWKTWVRLALIPAGKDWRALNNDTYANLYQIVPWDTPSATVTGAPCVSNGAISAADPNIDAVTGYGNKYKITSNESPSPTVTGSRIGSGAVLVADKLHHNRWSGAFRVVHWDKPAPTITGNTRTGGSNGISAVCDPRLPEDSTHYSRKFKVNDWEKPARTITCDTDIQTGAVTVNDPRLPYTAYNRALRLCDWEKPSQAVTSGETYTADPRRPKEMRTEAQPIPAENDRGVWLVIAEDGTWHRPITTFEMAMIQSLPPTFPDGTPLVLTGKSESKWREHIGNMVPPDAAEAIAGAMLETMMPNMLFDEWYWNFEPEAKIWVREHEKGKTEAIMRKHTATF